MNKSIYKIQAARKQQKKRIVFIFSGIVFSVFLMLTFIILTKGTKLEIKPQDASETAEIELVRGVGMNIGQKFYSILGPTEIKVSASGFIPELINLGEDNPSSFIEIYLREAPAQLKVTSRPSRQNTRWFVDSEFNSIAEEMKVEIIAGKHIIKIDNPFYHTDQKDIEVTRGETVNLVMKLLPVLGQLNINTQPSGASITLDNTSSLLSPRQFKVNGGRHKIHISHPDFENIDEIIEVTNQNFNIERNYRLLPKKAHVRFKLSPPGGVLMLDGKIITETDFLSVLALKDHNVLYSKPGYITQRHNFSFAPKENGRIELNLKKDIGILQIINNQNAFGCSRQDGSENHSTEARELLF